MDLGLNELQKKNLEQFRAIIRSLVEEGIENMFTSHEREHIEEVLDDTVESYIINSPNSLSTIDSVETLADRLQVNSTYDVLRNPDNLVSADMMNFIDEMLSDEQRQRYENAETKYHEDDEILSEIITKEFTNEQLDELITCINGSGVFDFFSEDTIQDIIEYDNSPDEIMWNTLFESNSSYSLNLSSNADKIMSETGMYVVDISSTGYDYEHTGEMLAFGGCGYDFYDSHWIPLFISEKIGLKSNVRDRIYKLLNFDEEALLSRYDNGETITFNVIGLGKISFNKYNAELKRKYNASLQITSREFSHVSIDISVPIAEIESM